MIKLDPDHFYTSVATVFHLSENIRGPVLISRFLEPSRLLHADFQAELEAACERSYLASDPWSKCYAGVDRRAFRLILQRLKPIGDFEINTSRYKIGLMSQSLSGSFMWYLAKLALDGLNIEASHAIAIDKGLFRQEYEKWCNATDEDVAEMTAD